MSNFKRTKTNLPPLPDWAGTTHFRVQNTLLYQKKYVILSSNIVYGMTYGLGLYAAWAFNRPDILGENFLESSFVFVQNATRFHKSSPSVLLNISQVTCRIDEGLTA